MSVWRHMHMSSDAHRGKRNWIPLELEIWPLMYVLRIEFQSLEEQYVLLKAEPSPQALS